MDKVNFDQSDVKKNFFEDLFTKFERDEVHSSAPFIWMSTMYHNDTEKFDSYDGVDYLIVVPGVEGHGAGVERVCRRLKLRALLCQFITNTSAHTVHQLATELIQNLITKIAIGKKFNILAYEFGTLVAVEMAAIFEETGLEGKVIFLEETPSSFSKNIQSLYSSTTEERLESDLLVRLSTLVDGRTVDGREGELEMMLEVDPGWPQKVDTCLRYLRDKCGSSTGYLRDVFESARLRLRLSRTHRSQEVRLKTPATLIRLTPGPDPGLDQATAPQVETINVEMDWDQVADVINKLILGV